MIFGHVLSAPVRQTNQCMHCVPVGDAEAVDISATFTVPASASTKLLMMLF